MKLHNKKGLVSGLFWTVLGISALLLELVRPSGNTAVFIRDLVLFSLLILFGVRQVVRAFSIKATREDLLEERDERNKYIRHKAKDRLDHVQGCRGPALSLDDRLHDWLRVYAGRYVGHGRDSGRIHVGTIVYNRTVRRDTLREQAIAFCL